MKLYEKFLLLIWERSTDSPVWTPPLDKVWIECLGEYLYVYGSGARSALNALRRRGWLDRMGEAYQEFYEITEHGRAEAMRLRSELPEPRA